MKTAVLYSLNRPLLSLTLEKIKEKKRKLEERKNRLYKQYIFKITSSEFLGNELLFCCKVQ